MGILDDAIREHLELKRQHGAGDSELKQLEGEAFGPTERPGDESAGADSAAEAPTEFMQAPDLEEGEAAAGTATEATSPAGDLKPPETGEQPRVRQTSAAEIADLQEAPEAKPESPPEVAAPEPEPEPMPEPGPAEEEAPAMEHEAIPPPEASEPQGPSTEEREAIAGPPTELYDVEDQEFGAESEATPGKEAAQELALPAEDEDEEDDFFDEKRLSDELDDALDAPLEAHEDEEPEPKSETELIHEPEAEEEASPGTEHDVLEETPDFLEESEDNELWFEQKPPKDFDFDD